MGTFFDLETKKETSGYIGGNITLEPKNGILAPDGSFLKMLLDGSLMAKKATPEPRRPMSKFEELEKRQQNRLKGYSEIEGDIPLFELKKKNRVEYKMWKNPNPRGDASVGDTIIHPIE